MTSSSQKYISKELVHFVGRGSTQIEQFDLLLKILNEGWILHRPFNPNVSGNLTVNASASISENEMYAPEIICFADIPFQDLSLHMEKYSYIGISFSKELIVKAGGVPVHYLPKNSNVKRRRSINPEEMQKIISQYGYQSLSEHLQETLSKGEYFDQMLKEYHTLFDEFKRLARNASVSPGVSEIEKRIFSLQKFFDFHVFSYFKFFNHMKADNDSENYYFEREWRIVGNMQFSLNDVDLHLKLTH